jgi:hypothetical protein
MTPHHRHKRKVEYEPSKSRIVRVLVVKRHHHPHRRED